MGLYINTTSQQIFTCGMMKSMVRDGTSRSERLLAKSVTSEMAKIHLQYFVYIRLATQEPNLRREVI
jgi:hypothetical protein